MSEMDPGLVTRIPPEKRPPPSTRAVALVLIGVIVLACVGCVGAAVSYGFFLEVRARRA